MFVNGRQNFSLTVLFRKIKNNFTPVKFFNKTVIVLKS
jgi:hypothetical protein